MTQAKIKICGLTREEDIFAVNKVLPEYIGFVFAPGRRRVSFGAAENLRKILGQGILPVGVFVDERHEEILALLRHGIIEAVQLHGSEDSAYIELLKSQTSAPIIKAVAVRHEEDTTQETPADFLLLDKEGGGTGQAFDWRLVGRTAKPFFLAGGLSPENVASGIAAVRPYAVDVSSGVEIDGRKSHARIREFVRAVRGI